MSDVVVMGGGPIGLATAMLLGNDGRKVIVLEKDASPAPASASEAWERWERKGVAQFRQSHYMQPKFRHLLDEELPLVRKELQALGGRRHSLIGMFASTIQDRSPRPGDERFETLTARRPIIEAAFARVAENTPGVEVRRGVAVDTPIAESDRVPRIVGVQTRNGERIRADLVVDALGRRSSIVENITGLGGRAPYEEASDAGFAYYARHFRGVVPEPHGPFFTAMSTIGVLTLPADVDTWQY